MHHLGWNASFSDSEKTRGIAEREGETGAIAKEADEAEGAGEKEGCQRGGQVEEEAEEERQQCKQRLWLAIPAITMVLLRVLKYVTRYVCEVTHYVIHVTRNLNYVTRFLS